MKLFTLAALAAMLFSMNAHGDVREHGGDEGGSDLPKTTWRCEQVSNSDSGYRVDILASPTWVKIRQESFVGDYAPIDMRVVQTNFTGEITPWISCEQQVGEYSIRVLVGGGIVQILQSSPTARYAPIQLEEVKEWQ